METRPVSPASHGWGIATFIVALALACAVSAYVIHEKTYCHPIQPNCDTNDISAPPANAPVDH